MEHKQTVFVDIYACNNMSVKLSKSLLNVLYIPSLLRQYIIDILKRILFLYIFFIYIFNFIIIIIFLLFFLVFWSFLLVFFVKCSFLFFYFYLYFSLS